MLRTCWRRLPSGFRWAIRDQIQSRVEQAQGARFWRWESSSFAAPQGVEGRVSYLGRPELAREAARMFGGAESESTAGHAWSGVKVREALFVGALRIPHVLRLLVD